MSIEDRISREKAFHNDRFSDETREDQGKYYFAVKKGAAAFQDTVMKSCSKEYDILEYGCGDNSQFALYSGMSKSVTGIDISDVAVQHSIDRAKALNITNAKFHVMNAEALEFEDSSFDVIYGRGILHHLDLNAAYRELSRVLKPTGIAIFTEPLGHNAFLNLYRRLTPNARTVDEHPLKRSDFTLAKRYFRSVDTEHSGLMTLLSVPWRDTPTGEFLLNVTDFCDRGLFAAPLAKWQSWMINVCLTKPIKAEL